MQISALRRGGAINPNFTTNEKENFTMNYQTLEPIVREAVRNVLGSGYENFDALLYTCDPDEGTVLIEYDLGISVELSFDPEISPLSFFSGGVTMIASLDGDNGALHVIFGDGCSDIESAERAASEYCRRGLFGWSVEDELEEYSGLHLVSDFSLHKASKEELLSNLIDCIEELLEERHVDKLRPILRYFED